MKRYFWLVLALLLPFGSLSFAGDGEPAAEAPLWSEEQRAVYDRWFEELEAKRLARSPEDWAGLMEPDKPAFLWDEYFIAFEPYWEFGFFKDFITFLEDGPPWPKSFPDDPLETLEKLHEYLENYSEHSANFYPLIRLCWKMPQEYWQERDDLLVAIIKKDKEKKIDYHSYILKLLAWNKRQEILPELEEFMAERPDIASLSLARLGRDVSREDGQLFIAEWDNFAEVKELPEFEHLFGALLELGKPVGEGSEAFNYHPFFWKDWTEPIYIVTSAEVNRTGGLSFTGKIKDADRGTWRVDFGAPKDGLSPFCYYYEAGFFFQVSIGAAEWQGDRWAIVYWQGVAIS